MDRRAHVRRTLVRLTCALAGVASGAGVVAATAQQPLQSVDVSVVERTVDPEAFTLAEEARWLTADCAVPDDWADGRVPVSAVVRDADTGRVTRLSFDDAWARAESGDAWTLALCTAQA